MSQIFTDKGLAIAGTVVQASPAVVTQIKTTTKDKYESVQIGFGTRREITVSKAVRGHVAGKAGEKKSFRFIKEFRTEAGDMKVGDSIDVTTFNEGDTVTVSGISKGKGFQGVVKRHGFAGGRRSHGNKHSEREPGSIGSTGPQRVFKGIRMAGRMGSDRVSVKNLKIVKIDKVNNQIFLSGAVPGRKGTLLEIVAK